MLHEREALIISGESSRFSAVQFISFYRSDNRVAGKMPPRCMGECDSSYSKPLS